MARKINEIQQLKKIIQNHDIIINDANEISSYTFSPKELLHAKVSKEVSYLQFLANIQEYTKQDKKILTLPEILKREVLLFKNKFNQDLTAYHAQQPRSLWAYSEEHVGIDEKGIFNTRKKPVIVIIHGKGVLTPENPYLSLFMGQSTIRYKREEFQALLDGKLGITLISYDDFLISKETLGSQFGIVIPYEKAMGWSNRKVDLTLSELLNTPLAVARAGSKQLLKFFFPLGSYQDKLEVYHYVPEYINHIHPNEPRGGSLTIHISPLKTQLTIGHTTDHYNSFVYTKKLYEQKSLYQ